MVACTLKCVTLQYYTLHTYGSIPLEPVLHAHPHVHTHRFAELRTVHLHVALSVPGK